MTTREKKRLAPGGGAGAIEEKEVGVGLLKTGRDSQTRYAPAKKETDHRYNLRTEER